MSISRATIRNGLRALLAEALALDARARASLTALVADDVDATGLRAALRPADDAPPRARKNVCSR